MNNTFNRVYWVALLSFISLLSIGCASKPVDWRDNPLDAADQTFRWQRPETDHWGYTKKLGGPRWWDTGDITTAFGFTELLPSWNLDIPATSSQTASLHVRTRDAKTGKWSPWMQIGQWGPAAPASAFLEIKLLHEHTYGKVNVDILELDRPADAFALRVTISPGYDTLTDATMNLRRLTAVVSGPARGVDRAYVAALTDQQHELIESNTWRRDLPVPFKPQKSLPQKLWSRGCSPTATNMVMAYAGVDLPVNQTADGVYDKAHNIYGNWGRAVAFASVHGLDAELARFRSWDQLKATIADGQPVIASIRFEAGEFPSNPMGDTDGHLIVIRGLTTEGDAIVNDPAISDDNAGDGIVYKADELARAWLGKGGVAYLIRRPD